MYKILVCGGRNFTDKEFLYGTLDREKAKFGIIRTEIEIITGGARGADSLAEEWARDRKVNVTKYPANWEKHGKAAGPIRNREMLCMENPDLVLAFPGGRGTADMIRKAIQGGYKVALALPEFEAPQLEFPPTQ